MFIDFLVTFLKSISSWWLRWELIVSLRLRGGGLTGLGGVGPRLDWCGGSGLGVDVVGLNLWNLFRTREQNLLLGYPMVAICW